MPDEDEDEEEEAETAGWWEMEEDCTAAEEA